jgi:hypothetical protein
MRKNKFIFERVGLEVFEIELKNGTVYKNIRIIPIEEATLIQRNR